ncbi:MAG: hypothetical protein IT165_29660 [Bryobacterales bacterium]|nr:hypothetical protein [Bryobacterales bacterium]
MAVFTDPPGTLSRVFQDVIPDTVNGSGMVYYPHTGLLLSRFISIGCQSSPILLYCPEFAGQAGDPGARILKANSASRESGNFLPILLAPR